MISVTLFEIFSENVRSLMRYHGITQTELARRLGVTPSFVSQILSGHRRPGLDSIENFSTALGVEPHRLLEKVPEKIAG